MFGVLKSLKIVVSCAVLAMPFSAEAADPDFLTVAVGAYDLVQDHDQALEFRAEYRSDKKIWIVKPFIGLMGTTDSTVYGNPCIHAGNLNIRGDEFGDQRPAENTCGLTR